MLKFPLVTTVLLVLALQSTAQNNNFLADTAYFRQQAAVYQKWLIDSGLGNTLHVYTVEAKPNALNLFLAFNKENSEYCEAAWLQLQKDFSARPGLSLEQTLYYKMIQLMETPQELSRILIYDTYNRNKKFNFEVKISFEYAKVAVKKSEWRSETRPIAIQPNNLSKLKGASVLQWQQQYDKARVFAAIQQYIKKRYSAIKCEQRFPTVETLENEEALRLKANDLCKEVLANERNPAICKILDCNWIKRERLTFTFSYAKDGQGFRLTMEVDGQYGSGFYNEVGRNGYKPMDQDFKEDLKDYADKLRIDIRQVLLNMSKP